MKRALGPTWSPEQRLAGDQIRQAWEEHFAVYEREGHEPLAGGDAKIAQVRARYETELMRRANVVGVAEGTRTRKGKPTGSRCLVVYVERKVPRAKLPKGDLIPHELDGVPVDVVEVGRIEPLPT